MTLSDLKRIVRDAIPARYQVPLKYHYNRFASMLEPELLLLPFLIKKGARAIDVGGNRGSYTYQLWRLGLRVESFEPNSRCSSLLTAWATDRPAVRVHSVGLSDKNGVAELFIPLDKKGVEHDASGSLGGEGFESSRKLVIELKTLDSYHFEDVCFIKIDVEGHELSVLEGGRSTIQAQTPAMLIEIEQRHLRRPIAEVFENLTMQGYQGFYLKDGRLLTLQNFEPERDQSLDSLAANDSGYVNNFVFLHGTRVERGEYSRLFANMI